MIFGLELLLVGPVYIFTWHKSILLCIYTFSDSFRYYWFYRLQCVIFACNLLCNNVCTKLICGQLFQVCVRHLLYWYCRLLFNDSIVMCDMNIQDYDVLITLLMKRYNIKKSLIHNNQIKIKSVVFAIYYYWFDFIFDVDKIMIQCIIVYFRMYFKQNKLFRICGLVSLCNAHSYIGIVQLKCCCFKHRCCCVTIAYQPH